MTLKQDIPGTGLEIGNNPLTHLINSINEKTNKQKGDLERKISGLEYYGTVFNNHYDTFIKSLRQYVDSESMRIINDKDLKVYWDNFVNSLTELSQELDGINGDIKKITENDNIFKELVNEACAAYAERKKNENSTGQEIVNVLNNNLTIELNAELKDLYTVSCIDDGKTLIINPVKKLSAATRSFNFTQNILGGVNIGFDGEIVFKKLEIKKISINQILQDQLISNKRDMNKTRDVMSELEKNGYGLEEERDIIERTASSGETGYFVLSKKKDIPGIVSLCDELAFFDLSSESVQNFSVRKPVIYIYGNKGKDIKVQVKLNKKAEFTEIYPEMNALSGRQNVRTNKDGTLSIGNCQYPYLFWEADCKKAFTIDLKKSYCISKSKVVSFLETHLEKLGLNRKEKTDFITYWMPELKSRPYAIIQFLGKEYEKYAKLRVEPTPESISRIYMIFQGADTPVETGNPGIEKIEKRAAYSVIEWGGTNLGIRENVPAHSIKHQRIIITQSSTKKTCQTHI